MSEVFIFAVLYATAFVVFPYLLLRSGMRREYVVVDVVTYVVAACVYLLAPHAGVVAGRDLSMAIFVAVKLFTCGAVFARAAAKQQLRDDATLLALFGLIVQLLLFLPASRIDLNGDEAQYLAISASIVDDFDLDLRNQYVALGLQPQLGDRTGPDGQQYSRLETFLPLLIAPGYAIAGESGAVATIFLFGFLLLRSILTLVEEERISRASRVIVFFFVAFGAPALFYSMRIWPEVPGAFFLTAALIELRRGNSRRLVLALLALSLLKLRFVVIAIPIIVLGYRRLSGRGRRIMMMLALVVLPLAGAYFSTGDPTGVHDPAELAIQSPAVYGRGLFGIFLDGQQGLLFTAPIFFIAIIATAGAKELPRSLQLGAVAALPYLLLLFPRPEWHGGWAPPLRYITVFTPLLALAAAVAIERFIGRTVVVAAAMGTAAFTIHGAVQPWRLFHIANGENVAGEYLSRLHGSDFSRFFPSFIRLNDAAVIGAVLLVCVMTVAVVSRRWRPMRIGGVAVVAATMTLSLIAANGGGAGRVVHLEDAHVTRRGGELYPHEYTVARFNYIGGWRFFAGDEATFLARSGAASLHYRSDVSARITLGSHSYILPASPHAASVPVRIAEEGRITLRCEEGSVIIDRLEHD